MRDRLLCVALGCFALGVAALDGVAIGRAAEVPAKPVDYQRDIAPILSRCTGCHSTEVKESGLNLQIKTDALKGGENGVVIVPGKSEQSLLVRLARGDDPDRKMPPPGESQPLTPEQLVTLKRWIDEGAVWPDSADGTGRNHWAYRKPTKHDPPKPKNAVWVINPIDAFVLDRLEREGLAPAPEADRPRWLRRVTIDLLGMPPTPEEVAAFVADGTPTAHETVVDRLLADPRYGERWARPWLDQARYADTNGYEKDTRRTMWPYRDWVIGALNRDLPFDRFTIEQIAGDLLPNATLEQKVASGFHRNTLINTEGGVDPEEARNNVVVDRVNTTASVWLASTLACAQCHTHKYDPFKQTEYYKFFAYYNDNADASLDPSVFLELPTPEQTRALAEISDLEKAQGKTPELKVVRDKLAETKKELLREIPKTMIMQDLPTPRETHLHVGGNFMSRGERVSAGVPAIFPQPEIRDGEPPNRLQLARWLVDRDNPLTARVAVNRIWEQYFGRGLVSTSEDFGTRGARPSHPELLDWLAVELMDQDWSLKKLHRTIVLSAVYRQSSRVTPELLARDPDNVLLARGPRNRLDAEMIRDTALFASGLLKQRIGGPSVMPPQPAGIWNSPYNGDKWVDAKGDDRYRRGLYTFWKRSAPYPAFMTFDAPSRELCVVKRSKSNTPMQALTTLNDPSFVEAAQALARRVRREAADDDARIARIVRLVLSREPTADDRSDLLKLLADVRIDFSKNPADAKEMAGDLNALATPPTDPKQKPTPPAPEVIAEQAAWTTLANVVLNLDEALSR